MAKYKQTFVDTPPPPPPCSVPLSGPQISYDLAGSPCPTNYRKHSARGHLLNSTPATDSHVVTLAFPGDIEPRELYCAFHVVDGYGCPSKDPGGVLGYEQERLVIDGVLDAESGDVVEVSEGRGFQLRAVLEDRLEVVS